MVVEDESRAREITEFRTRRLRAALSALGIAIVIGAMVAVVGVTPTGRACLPSSAFTNVVLPWLNSPTTTR